MKTLKIVPLLLMCVLVYCEAHSVQGLKFQDYDLEKGHCNETNPCRYKGECTNETDGNFCRCKAGFSGDFCEIVDECIDLCVTDYRAMCVYDENEGKANCVCPDPTMKFDSVGKKCKVICQNDSQCENGGECKGTGEYSFCRCKRGVSGDSCSYINDCYQCGYEDDVICQYNVTTETTACTCENSEKQFDPVKKKCRECDCGPDARFCTWSNRKKICECHGNYVQKEGDFCEECGCGDESLRCTYKDGETICKCNKGFAQNGSTCEECVCEMAGSKCSFANGTKVCRCPSGYTQKDGICVRACEENEYGYSYRACRNGGICNETTWLCECKNGTEGLFCDEVIDCEQNKICGNGTDVNCYYNQETGKGFCQCRACDHLFDEKDLRCKECNCGTKGNCSIVNGEKSCKCEKNYIIHNGKCVECNCGKFGKCSFIGGVKNCTCNAGYATYKGQCLECRKPEKCGQYGACKFDDAGNKFCSCHPGHSLRFGRCTVCWSPATCGQHGSCKFDEDGNRFCACDPGYSLRFGKCKECWSPEKCGKYGVCKFDDYGRKFCACDRGYSLRLGKCAECWSPEKCGNYGVCKFDAHGRKFCSCDPGYSLRFGKCTDVCNPNPCKRGRCSFKDHAFSCRCDEGYTGKLCDQQESITNGKSNASVKIAAGVIGGLLGVSAIVLVVCVIRKRLLRANARGLATNIRNSDQMAEIRRNAY